MADSFEHLLAELSARFSGLLFDEVDSEIDAALQALTRFFGTDRASLFELRGDSSGMALTHSWVRPGLVRTPTDESIGLKLRWYCAQIRAGTVLNVRSLPDELPAEAIAEREEVLALGMRSHVVVPLEVGGSWVCAIAMAMAERERSFSEEEIGRIRTVGELLANALHRRNLEREVRELLRRLRAENAYLRSAVGGDGDGGFEQLVGKSPELRRVLELAAQVAPTSTAVLLLGETGTGKELMARAIHARSKRAEAPLITVNCAALPASLVESELFGHEKGAFTGATSVRLGRFELADGGTLFLDEVGELAEEIQAKLLRVLESGEFERVGAVRSRKVDVRLIAATNRPLEHEVRKGSFRADLYYRLSVFPITVPPLRERPGDIPLLVWEIIHRRQHELGRHIEHVSESAMQALCRYAWPGNIRELGNVIERALILSPGTELRLDAFIASQTPLSEISERADAAERSHLLEVLERHHWRIDGHGNAADCLGLNPSTLRSRLRKLGIVRPHRAIPVDSPVTFRERP
ncbi:MAG TPA: sigma 54-interacting transcriptional regulator [Myxococcota bacterium]|nr:sigma 54-interacting transcriptional regulator [Myxococcota bacterium]